MKLADTDILFVPGLGNSDAGHWQRRWCDKIVNSQWVEQDDWYAPDRDLWVKSLERAILMATRPIVLVGHSFGVATIVHTAKGLVDTKVRGAMLVSPLGPNENPEIAIDTTDFRDMPRDPLPFPSMLISSSTDPYCTQERAADLASCWGSEFHDAGEAGHINLASGHGPWPEGLMMFTRLMQRLKA